jgi:thiol-disulfide isomerase/thioredoxin
MSITNRFIVVTVAGFFLAVGAASAAPAPKVALVSLNALPIVISNPYDTSADANADVNAAFARAQTSGKRVLIDLGGNWCPDCIILSNVMRLPEVAPFVEANYEVVMVDVGRFNRNLQIPARFGFTHRLEGVPFMLVADPDGKLLNAGNTATLDVAHAMKPQAIVDWLASWTK